MIFKKIDNMENVEVICHYFPLRYSSMRFKLRFKLISSKIGGIFTKF